MKNVLVVDDDEMFRTLLSEALDPEKYEVSVATNGEEALAKVEEKRPDIVLLDLKMPSMDGMEFLGKINEKFGVGKVPVLIVSNTSSIDSISEAVALGARGYVAKTDTMQGVIASMERLF